MFFSIIKIIGILLLVIISLVLITALYVICFPISYAALGDFDKKKYRFLVYDILHILTARIEYKESLLLDIRLFGFLKILSKELLKKDGEKEKKDKKKKSKEKDADHAKERRESKKETVKHLFSDTGKEGIVVIIKEVFGFLKKLAPRVFRAQIDFSLKEPDLTGYLTGLLATLPFCYGKHVHIYPDFTSDEAFIEGKMFIKGMLIPAWIIGLFFRILANKKSRYIVSIIRHR